MTRADSIRAFASLHSINSVGDGYMTLLGMVIYQALWDATKSRKEIASEALDFIRGPGLDFVCDLVGWDPLEIRGRCERAIRRRRG